MKIGTFFEQEFTGAKMVDGFMNKNTHRVILTAPVVGCRACGIVINHRICHCIILNSEIFRPRASSVCIHWEGWNLKVIGSHLAPNHSREDYTNSINDIQDIIDSNTTRTNFQKTKTFDLALLDGPIYNIGGIDAQVSVGPPIYREETPFIGSANMGNLSRS